MIAIVQVISSGSVRQKGDINSNRKIENGLLVLLGVSKTDTENEVQKVVDKLTKLRVFQDNEQKMNLDIKTIKGEILLISQFTLFGDVKGNNRPDFSKAADKELATKLYNLFADKLIAANIATTKGFFGEHMELQVNLDGPVTITIDSDKI